MVTCPGCGEENPPKFRLCGYCGTPLAAAAAPLPVREVRKTVTLVFSDLKGSTALGETLDAEAVHEVKERYFKALSAEILRHGGKIEKYIGDAIMAVFGLPQAHEDDALRAVRAALDMGTALERVNAELRERYGIELAHRIGVNTGEVVANDAPGADQKLATGDAVNLAARLEQAAPAGEIYIGETTYQLVRDAVHAEPVEPLTVKGKARPVAVWRVTGAHGVEGNQRRTDTPIVGRERELESLATLYAEVTQGPCARMATVIADAGSGKSRLVHEVAQVVARGARVLRGRCLAYGDGITFWPLRVMLGAARVRDGDSPQEARRKLMALIGEADVVERIAAATGLSDASFPLHEVYWAARRVLERIASRGPVVVVIDDIHWAEPAFLDLLLHVLDASRGAPILLLATARPELLQEQPDWGQRPDALRIVLPPLSADAAARVVQNLAGGDAFPEDLAARIVQAADGNPLYVEQLMSMLIETGALRREEGRWLLTREAVEISVPPTVQALLEARLDRLAREERAAMEPAAVIGLDFTQPAVGALVAEGLRGELSALLDRVARRMLIRPLRGDDAEPAFRFQHQMVRDTVYNGLLKRARAQLHLAFVTWADRVYAERAMESQEILGYHLEQAHRYLGELGPLDAAGVEVGLEATRRLSQAARRAFARADFHAAINLFQRAARTAPATHTLRLALLPELGEALMEVGRFAEARAVLDEAIATAETVGDARLLASARLRRMFVRLFGGEGAEWSAPALRECEEAIAVLGPLQAHDELAVAWRLTAFVHGVAGRYVQANEATVHYMDHARKAGNRRLVARSGLGLANGLLPGPTPVAEGIERCLAILADIEHDRQVSGIVMCIVGQLHAMNGEFDTARDLCRRGRGLLQALGKGVMAAQTCIDLARVEMLAGNPGAAERELRADHDFLRAAGETYVLSTVAAVLARLTRDQGREDEAWELTEQAQAAAADDDVDAQVQWRAVRAPILARRGDASAAEALMREALELAYAAEAPLLQAEALGELGAVLALGGRLEEAAASYEEAAALLEAKGDRVSAARARRRQAELGDQLV